MPLASLVFGSAHILRWECFGSKAFDTIRQYKKPRGSGAVESRYNNLTESIGFLINRIVWWDFIAFVLSYSVEISNQVSGIV